MKSRSMVAFLSLLVGALLAAACLPAAPASSPPAATPASLGSKAAPAAQVVFPLTITDGAGRQVTIQKEPKRIVSLAPSNTEILFALGLGDSIVGVTTYCDYPEEAKTKPKIGGTATVNLELVVAAAPDLILGTNTHAKKIVPELESKGLTAVVLDPGKMDDVLAAMMLVGQLTGRTKEAEAVVGQMKAGIMELEGRVANARTSPRVFWEVTRELVTPAPSSFIGDMITRAGGSNIVKETSVKWPRISQEVVIASDPEVIIIGDHTEQVTPEEIAGRPGWKVLSAVKTGRMVAVNPDLVNRAGPRVVDGFEMVVRAIHPEVFP